MTFSTWNEAERKGRQGQEFGYLLADRRISDNKPKSSRRDTCELICHGPNFDENKIRDSSEKREIVKIKRR